MGFLLSFGPTILFSYVLLSTSAFRTINPAQRKIFSQDTLQHSTGGPCLLYSTNESEEPIKSSKEDEPLNLSRSSPPSVPAKRVDPLIASLTRNDRAPGDAPKTSLPLLGEIELDQSLFIILPVAAFAFFGFAASFYVAINSGDAFVEAAQSINDSLTTPKALPDPNVCRGLCSSQEQDLAGLKVFMDGLRK